MNIRKFTLRASRLSDLVELGSITPHAAAFLKASVRAGLNILVAGGTQTGKTTFLNCLASSIPGGDRVISAQEVFELRFSHPDWVPLQTRQAGLEGTGEIRLRDLVKESLRMRPSRIIVGEVRAEECLDLLLALNSGLPGMCTLHANSAREALVKMCTLPLLAGETLTTRLSGELQPPYVGDSTPFKCRSRGRRRSEGTSPSAETEIARSRHPLSPAAQPQVRRYGRHAGRRIETRPRGQLPVPRGLVRDVKNLAYTVKTPGRAEGEGRSDLTYKELITMSGSTGAHPLFAPDHFAGKVAVVTGGTSGLGFATATLLAQLGATVHALGLGADDVSYADGLDVTLREVDVTDDQALGDFFAGLDRLHVLIPAAGVTLGPQELTAEGFRKVIDINLHAVQLCCELAAPLMTRAGGGSIVNFASMLSYFGSDVGPAYAASKGAIVQLTKSLAQMHADDGIRVNAVAPGWVQSQLLDQVTVDEALASGIIARTPLNRFGRAEEVAQVIAFLSSDAASFVTGAVLPVDGGYLTV